MGRTNISITTLDEMVRPRVTHACSMQYPGPDHFRKGPIGSISFLKKEAFTRARNPLKNFTKGLRKGTREPFKILETYFKNRSKECL